METKEIEAVVSDANGKGEASMPTTASTTTTAKTSVNRTVIGFGAIEGGSNSVKGVASVTVGSLTANGPVYVQNAQTDHGMAEKITPQEYMTAIIRDYESFESREQNMTDVMEALKDPDISVIGVHGMPGVGKTMLAEKAMEQAINGKLFDEVAMATVSQNQDFRHIQAQIAYPLNLKFNEEILEGRAVSLHKRLDGKKILLILDDIWDKLDLKKVGIPSTGRQSKLKILITSRYRHVLSDKMNTNKNIEIGLLSKDEPWRFFSKIVGEAMAKAPYMEQIGRDVVKECAGLPMALAIVANVLKNKEEAIWRHALEVLKNPAEEDLQEVNKEVYHAIKLCYDFLQAEAQSLFLLCSVFPEDYNIDKEELFMYGKGMGLLLSKGTLARGRDNVVKLVDDLKSACLLLESGRDGRHVKMHDVVRDVAIRIASKDKGRHLLSHGHGLKMWPAGDTHGSYTAIFMDCGNFEQVLPEKLKFPKLEILLLRKSYLEIKVSDTFLEDMKELKVLHLEKIHISSPFSSLKNLQTLGLQECRLENVGIVGELSNLEILSFKGSDIKELSNVLSKLTQLKMLDLTDCSGLKVIPPNLISSLSNLEELYMENSFIGWEGERTDNERKNASLSELIDLPLTTLYISIPNANILPRHLFSGELKKYRIVIGREWSSSKSTNGAQRALEVKANSSMFLEDGVKLLVKNSKELWLTEIEALENIRSALSSSTSLRKLSIEDCQVAVDSVIAPSSSQERLQPLFDEQVALTSLETLEILNTNKFEILLNKWQLPKTFPMLREIRILGCNDLKRMFPSNTWRVLQHLEELEIKECQLLEEIFDPFGSEEKAGDVMFIKLKRLVLVDLPKLKKVWSKEEGLETTTIHLGFPALTFLGLIKLPCLEALCAGIHTSEWLSLDRLEVHCCGSLNSLNFTSVTSRVVLSGNDYLPSPIFEIPNLRELHLESCKWEDMKLDNLPGLELCYLTKFQCQNMNITNLPKLRRLHLESSEWQDMKLDNLSCITSFNWKTCKWQDMSITHIPNLMSLHLKNCQWRNMGVTNLPEVMSLDLENCQWKDMQLTDLPNLISINWENCQYQDMHVDNLRKLRRLHLESCKWRNMKLDNLPRLTSFYWKNCKWQAMAVIDMPELMSSDLENCQWQYMMLENLPCLTSFYWKNCKWQAMMVTNLPELMSLDLENCQCQILYVDNLPKLRRLHLDSCKWQNMMLLSLPCLTSFYSKNCKWQNVKVTELAELMSLDLENCECQNMHVDNLPKLAILNVESGNFQTVCCTNVSYTFSYRRNYLYQNKYLAELPSLHWEEWVAQIFQADPSELGVDEAGCKPSSIPILQEDRTDLGDDEAGELAPCERVQAKRRQKWTWGSIAAALTLGTAALAWSYTRQPHRLVRKQKISSGSEKEEKKRQTAEIFFEF